MLKFLMPAVLSHSGNRILIALLLFFMTTMASGQKLTYYANQIEGNGTAFVKVEIVTPAATSGDNYRVFFNKNTSNDLLYSLENSTRQQRIIQQLPLGVTSDEFDGVKVTVTECHPCIDEILEVAYGGNSVNPPVHVFRPGDLRERGGANSTNEYTFVGGGAPGDISTIARSVSNAAPYDFELRFDGDPLGRNAIVHIFSGDRGTHFGMPFSLWNIGIGTPNDPSDDYQIVAVGYDDSGNPAVYDGGASPSDGGPGTMFDRIYFYDLNRNGGANADLNNDGIVSYDDFLFDVNQSGGDVSTLLTSRQYIRSEVLSRFSMVSLNSDPMYVPPVGTTIRVTTSKALSESDIYAFSTPIFAMSTLPSRLSFGAKTIGGVYTLPLQFQNNHTSEVTVSNIVASHPAFSVSETAFTLAPAGSHTIEISFSPQQPGVFNAEIIVTSNDPFYPNYSVPVTAKSFAQTGSDVKLLGQHDVHPSVTADIWGYVDQNGGREYAIVGYGYFSNPPNAGMMIFDVTEPANPVKVSEIKDMPGFDVKTWKQYAYSVNGNSSGMFGRVADLSDIHHPQVVGSFPTAHNLFISQDGYMILAIPGIRVYDLNPNPVSPTFVWSDNQGGGHDAHVIGDTLFDFHGGSGTFIYNFSKPIQPEQIGAITDPAISYHHSGWTSKDGKYLFICDELASDPTPDITIWDISVVGNPSKVGQYADPDATVHNLQVVGDYAFISYYTAGFRVLNISNPANPREVERFDTSFSTGEGYDGAFGVYAFAPSRNIYISDGQNGLFLFSFESIRTGIGDPDDLPTHYALFDNYPNPFNPRTTISYQLPVQSKVKLTIFNIIGQPVRTLVDAEQKAGQHTLTWDGLNKAQEQVSSGIYFYKLETGDFRKTKRMLLLR